MLAHEGTGCTRVVEVDVGEKEVPDLAELVAALREACPQSRQRRRRSAVEQGKAVVGLDEVAADVPPAARVQEVDRYG